MKDGAHQQKRDQAQTERKALGGSRGYQEVGCDTVSCYDAEGNRLLTRRLARMPEAKKDPPFGKLRSGSAAAYPRPITSVSRGGFMHVIIPRALVVAGLFAVASLVPCAR